MMILFLSNILTYAQTSEGIYSMLSSNGWENHEVLTITFDKKNEKLNAKQRNRDGEAHEVIFKEVEIVSGEKIIIKNEFTRDGQVNLYFLTIRSEDNWETFIGDISEIKPDERLGFAKVQGEFSSGDNVIKMYSDKLGSKKVATKSNGLEGYKDFKFGMTREQIKATGVCENFDNLGGQSCYKIAGKKRDIYFTYDYGGLSVIRVYLGKYRSAFYKKLVSGIGKKYKEKYRLTMEQALGNNGNNITYFENARITLVQEDVGGGAYNVINLYYTKEEHPTFKTFAADVTGDDF